MDRDWWPFQTATGYRIVQFQDLSTAHRRWAFDPIGGCNITDAVLYMCNKHTAALSLSSMLITWQVEHFADCGVQQNNFVQNQVAQGPILKTHKF